MSTDMASSYFPVAQVFNYPTVYFTDFSLPVVTQQLPFLIKQLKFNLPNSSCKDYRIQCLVICNINPQAPVTITRTTTNWPHRYICTYITTQHPFSVRYLFNTSVYLFTVTFFNHTWRLKKNLPLMTNMILCVWSRQLFKSVLIPRKKTLAFKIW